MYFKKNYQLQFLNAQTNKGTNKLYRYVKWIIFNPNILCLKY